MLARYMRERTDRPVRYAIPRAAARNYLGMLATSHGAVGSAALPHLLATFPPGAGGMGHALTTPAAQGLFGEFMDDHGHEPLQILRDLLQETHGDQYRGIAGGVSPLARLLAALGNIEVDDQAGMGEIERTYGDSALLTPQIMSLVRNHLGGTAYLPRRLYPTDGLGPVNVGIPYRDLLRAHQGRNAQLGMGTNMLTENIPQGVPRAATGISNALHGGGLGERDTEELRQLHQLLTGTATSVAARAASR